MDDKLKNKLTETIKEMVNETKKNKPLWWLRSHTNPTKESFKEYRERILRDHSLQQERDKLQEEWDNNQKDL